MTDQPNPAMSPPDELRQPAYDAVFAFIRGLGEKLPTYVAHRNAMIWRAVHAALDAVATPAPPADRTALRARIAEAARGVPLRLGPNAVAMTHRGEPVILNMSEADDLADAVLAVLPPPADRAAALALTDAERAMLNHALNQVQLKIWAPRNAFTEDDQAAVDSLRRMAAERDSLGREADRLRKDWVEMRARAERAEVDRAAVLDEAAALAESLRQFEPAYGARKSAQVSENVGVLRVADVLRRMAAEETHVVADGSDDPEHVDDCPGCETAEARATDTQDSEAPGRTRAETYREAATELANAFGDPMAKHIGALGASFLRCRAREIEADGADRG